MLSTFDSFQVTVTTPRRAEILPTPSSFGQKLFRAYVKMLFQCQIKIKLSYLILSTGTSRSHMKKKGNNEDTPVHSKGMYPPLINMSLRNAYFV